MQRNGFLFALIIMMSLTARAEFVNPEPVLRSLPCLLKYVEGEMNTDHKPSVKMPTVFLAHTVPLKQFQDDVESQWNMRPDVITNVFVAHTNRIYLTSDKAYYQKNKRNIYDSLVHELVHYIQVKYRGFPIDQLGDAEEMIAIDIQATFREKHPELLNQDFVCN